MAESPAAQYPTDPSRRPSAGRVSLVMATFRRTHCLGETARQLLDQQSRPPFELIVVNNDPAPGAEQAVRDALPADPRIRVTTCTTGRQGACRNHGLRMATGDYVAFVDDDDDYTPAYIARLAAALDMGVRSVRCQIQTCGCAGPDCNGRPTRAHHPLTPNTMARRDVLTPTWNDPPSEDRDYWSRHPIEGAIDDCLVITCQGPGRHSPRNNAQGGSWRVRFAVTLLVAKDASRYLKGVIASLQSQTYGHFQCVVVDQSADKAVGALLARTTANDQRFSVVQPLTPSRDSLERALANGAHELAPDDVLLVLHGNERLAHPGVLNRLAHVYTEQNDVWVTYGGCATEPLTPAWPQASFPPSAWRSRTFRTVSTLIGEYAPLTLRAPFLRTLQASLSAADSALPTNGPVDADEHELPLFLLALEAAGPGHVYPMSETQVIKGLEQAVYRDAAQRRDALARQFEIRNRPSTAAIDVLSPMGGESPTAKEAPVPVPSESAGSPPLAWFGPVYDPSGYGNEARSFVLALDDQAMPPSLRAAGHHSAAFREAVDGKVRARLDAMLVRPIDDGFVGVIHMPPSFMQRIPGADYLIGRTMFETDGLSPDLVERCNLMDELWVPSAFNAETFRRAGVRARLVRMPGAIDSTRFRPGLEPLPIPGVRGTVFLSTIEWKPRKGWHTLLAAWADAFDHTDEVSLVFRASIPGQTESDCAPEILRQIDAWLAERGRSRAELAPIIVLGRQVPDADVPRLYAAASVYVTASSGEGWGYPYMEAMASGLLTIATRWSGNLEFMHDENSLLCDVESLIPAIDEYVGPMPGQSWAQPSVTHLAQLLRVPIDDPVRATRLVTRAREEMQTTWTWERSARMVRHRLREIAAERALHATTKAASTSQTSSAMAESAMPESAMPVAVHWEGPLFTHSSLGLVNRELCTELLARGDVQLTVSSSQADDFVPGSDGPYAALVASDACTARRRPAVHVAHQWPPRLTPPREGVWVMMQPWEYGGLPGAWIPVIRDQVDEYWVYCSWQRECAIQSGIPAEKVVVVPIGANPARYRPDGERYPLKTRKRTKLLAIGGIIPRKGMDLLVETYLRTFTASDDVCLVIKGLSARWAYQGNAGQRDFAQLPALAQADGAAEIEFIGDTLEDDEIASLYRACDALVAPFRGEGFGLPIAEAMASALPVIVTEAGPVFDICDAESAYLIPAGQSVPDQRLVGLEPGALGFWWADPDVQALSHLMRHVVDHPDEAREKGARARTRIMKHFTYARGASIAAARLRALSRRQPVRSTPPAAFHADVSPHALDQPRRMVFLHHPAWHATSWRDVITGYLRAFSQEHDVSMVLLLDPAQGITEEYVADAMTALRAAAGRDDAEAPDILLVTDDLDDQTLAALYRAAACVVVTAADAAGAARAQAVGTAVLTPLEISAWHRAASAALGDSWQQVSALASAP
jgi:glycosyltransferase involved in cell wall biosynthesis